MDNPTFDITARRCLAATGLMPGGQNWSKRQTVFCTSVDPMNKEHKDPNKVDLEAPRLAWYQQKSGRNINARSEERI